MKQETSQPEPVMPEAVKKEYSEMLTWISDSMITQSLLYDLDRLPEQLKIGSREWREMTIIVTHMKAIYEDGAKSAQPTPTSAKPLR